MPTVDLPALDVLVVTRTSLHRVAEHVLAAALKRATGQIALRPLPGGIGTPPLPDDGAVLQIRGAEMVVRRGGEQRQSRLTTVRAAARLAGVEPGFPWTKHEPATPYEPDAPLTVDDASARLLAEWCALGDATLRRWAAEVPEDELSSPLVFPEHFDLGCSSPRSEVNYGFSPGDSMIPLPYVYVGPWAGPPTSDEFWNAAFGAYRTIDAVPDLHAALAFLREARARMSATPDPLTA
jgi:hypothetical protein